MKIETQRSFAVNKPINNLSYLRSVVAQDEVRQAAMEAGADENTSAIRVLARIMFRHELTDPALAASCAVNIAKYTHSTHTRAIQQQKEDIIDVSSKEVDEVRQTLRNRLNQMAGEKARPTVKVIEDAEVVDGAAMASDEGYRHPPLGEVRRVRDELERRGDKPPTFDEL